MNQPQTGAPRPAVSKWLLVVLIVVVLAGGGFFAWYYLMGPGKKVATTTTPTTTTTKDKTTTDPTKNWQTYNDEKYSVSFKYPETWPKGILTSYKKGEADLLPDIAFDGIGFESDTDKKYSIHYREIEISPLTDYQNVPNSSYIYSELHDDYTKIMNVYNNKSASGAEELWMPPSNASIEAATKPVYIENDDSTYHGVYYFANIGQDYGTNLNFVAVLTNGQNVFQLSISMESDKAAQYKSIDQKNNFSKYVESLTASSDETITKEFTSTYQYIIKSVK